MQMKSVRKLVLAAALILLTSTGAHADPILTPLLVTAVGTVGITGTAATITASIASYAITAGAALPLSILRGRS